VVAPDESDYRTLDVLALPFSGNRDHQALDTIATLAFVPLYIHLLPRYVPNRIFEEDGCLP
jgi:hypothetical protein